ncbi:unnamed protein product [Ectocarpus sp. 12 AP-2014]
MPAVAASQVNGGAPLVHGGLDLCGALSQANVDARSPAVRELRLALSFPDLEEGLPTDLLEAAKLHQPPGRPANHPVGDGYQHGLPERTIGKEVTVLWQSPRGVLRSSKGKCGKMFPIDEFAPPWESDNGGHLSGVIHDAANHEVAALELEPVGWERTEADWNDPSFPKWALACAPLATGEGGGPSSKRAFELCYREHFGWAGLGGSLGEANTTAKAEVEVVRRALAALQGVPSGYFWYDETHAQMRVCGHVGQDGVVEEAPLMPPRVAGLSPGALSSLLEEFAVAGTWYRRVQEFVRCLVNASSSNGQVARAFGIELRRQLTEVESALLGVTMELEGLGWNDSEMACRPGTQDTPLNEQRCCSLAGVLAYTTQLRRAVGALAEICGLSEDDLRSAGGVRAVFNAFPRGASLLTYLYKAAEVRVASKLGGESTCFFGRVMAEGDSALALLNSAATPYLAMLGRWLWSGEMWAEDDPCEEFPLRCRERLTGSDTSKATKEPWTEDGGGSFMSLAFCENGAAGVPCFLAGGVLHAAARAGKLLRMLKAAADSGGAVSRARDSSTRCGKRYEDWNDTWGWERTVTGGREVGSRETPAATRTRLCIRQRGSTNLGSGPRGRSCRRRRRRRCRCRYCRRCCQRHWCCDRTRETVPSGSLRRTGSVVLPRPPDIRGRSVCRSGHHGEVPRAGRRGRRPRGASSLEAAAKRAGSGGPRLSENALRGRNAPVGGNGGTSRARGGEPQHYCRTRSKC